MASLFETVLQSISDPQRGTQQADLQGLLGALLGGGASPAQAPQVDPAAAEGLAGSIGAALKPALQQAQQQSGMEGVDSLLNAIKENAHSPQRLEQTLGPERMEQMVNKAKTSSGLPVEAIMSLLPVILPAVIGLLQSGRVKSASAGAPAPAGASGLEALASNPIVKSFLDSDGDGDVDMQDIIRQGMRMMQQGR